MSGAAHSTRQADAIPAGDLIARHRRRADLDERERRWAEQLSREPIFRDPPARPGTDPEAAVRAINEAWHRTGDR